MLASMPCRAVGVHLLLRFSKAGWASKYSLAHDDRGVPNDRSYARFVGRLGFRSSRRRFEPKWFSSARSASSHRFRYKLVGFQVSAGGHKTDQAGYLPNTIEKAEATVAEQSPALPGASTVIENRVEVVDSVSVESVEPAMSRRFSWRFALGAIYLGGLTVVLLPTVVGRWGLLSLVRRGDRPSEHVEAIARQAASQLRLTTVPMVRSCPDLTMPLVHGFLVPKVLVPKEFSDGPCRSKGLCFCTNSHMSRVGIFSGLGWRDWLKQSFGFIL